MSVHILESSYDVNTERLYKTRQDLVQVPDGVFELTDLKLLHLDENKIDKIPTKILSLNKLILTL